MRYVAICPSNQDRNQYPAGGNEHVHMHLLAQTVETVLREDGVTAKYFPAAPESKDSYRLEGLIRQQSDAVRWLKEQRAPFVGSLILNLHSDSGEESHVGYYFHDGPDSESARAGRCITASLEAVMQTEDVRSADYSAYVFAQNRGGYTATLIEVGSHVNPHDVYVIVNLKEGMAVAISHGAIDSLPRYGEGLPPILDVPAYAAYFGQFGVACNPDAAIFKYWRAAYDSGANMGPAVADEEDGKKYGEDDSVVQKFANAVVVSKRNEGWKCYRAQVVLEPGRYLV